MKHVYLLRVGESQYKVGIASNVGKRIMTLQTSNAQRIDLVMSRLLVNASEVERQAHQRLAMLRSNGGKEWFKLTCEQAIDIAVFISSFPEPDMTEAIDSHRLLDEHRRITKEINHSLNDIVKSFTKQQKKSDTQPKEKVVLPKNKIIKSDKEIVIDAVAVVFRLNRASTSLLQRELKIGYSRAARVMYELEKLGIITESDGSPNARDVIGSMTHASNLARQMLE